MPKIPLAELHCSSIQHPRFPFGWLLQFRRVPCVPGSKVSRQNHEFPHALVSEMNIVLYGLAHLAATVCAVKTQKCHHLHKAT